MLEVYLYNEGTCVRSFTPFPIHKLYTGIYTT